MTRSNRWFASLAGAAFLPYVVMTNYAFVCRAYDVSTPESDNLFVYLSCCVGIVCVLVMPMHWLLRLGLGTLYGAWLYLTLQVYLVLLAFCGLHPEWPFGLQFDFL